MPQTSKNLNTIYISERMQERLRLISQSKLTSVVAPMGYGKTTAVDWYMKQRSEVNDNIIVRINIYSDNTALFWRSLKNALSGVGAGDISGFEYPQDDVSRGMAAEYLFRFFSEHREKYYIFIDDFHLIKDSGAVTLICMLARTLPDNVHLIVAGRDSFMPGGEILRLGRNIHHITLSDFKLNQTEISIYAKRCGAELDESGTDKLVRNSEGWFSAVYLNIKEYVEHGRFLNESADIYEMLKQALFTGLSEDDRRFLLVMSLADEFTAEMAEFITGKKNARDLIWKMTGENAFISVLADGKTYRFHYMLRHCAQLQFADLNNTLQKEYQNRYGQYHESLGQYIRALGFYEMSEDNAAWLRVVATDCGVMLASINPDDILKQLEKCSPQELKADPQALLVLMRRLFSWREIPKMLQLKELLLQAIKEHVEWSAESRGNLLGECDLIMSFLGYNDIEKMSALHQSACRQMNRSAISIKKYGSWTFGSPSVLMMFHRAVGKMSEEVEVMKRAMPYYYQVTNQHGAGAELLMAAEAAFMRGDNAAAEISLEKARQRAGEKSQRYLLLGCDFMKLRMSLCTGEAISEEWIANIHSECRDSHDALLMTVFDGCMAYYYSVLGKEDKIPTLFSEKRLSNVNIMHPAIPMMGLIENQVLLAQGKFAEVIGRQERLASLCGSYPYTLCVQHVDIQTAAACEAMKERREAVKFLKSAIDTAMPDDCFMPFVENYRFIGGLIEDIEAEAAELPEKAAFIQKIKELGESFEHHRKALLEAGRIPAAAGVLSEKELQIALMISQRRTNREIAEQLYFSEGTVKQYINRIYSKLGIDGGSGSKRSKLAEIMNRDV